MRFPRSGTMVLADTTCGTVEVNPIGMTLPFPPVLNTPLEIMV